MKRNGDWLQTFTGRQFWPLDPRPEDVDIVDIAHALSNVCRYAGHSARFYSVAEHSVLVASKADHANKMWALLHDASEAYICDIPRPLKPFISDYGDIERRVMRAVADRFYLGPEPEQVKELDTRILIDESAVLMPNPPAPWRVEGEPLGVSIQCWTPYVARRNFLAAFYEAIGLSRPAAEKEAVVAIITRRNKDVHLSELQALAGR